MDALPFLFIALALIIQVVLLRRRERPARRGWWEL